MATRKGSLPANMLVLLGIFIAAVVLFLVFSGSAGGRLSNLLNPVLGSISEPAKPDLNVRASCVNSGAVDSFFPQIIHSRLTLTVTNIGEAATPRNVPIRVAVEEGGQATRVATSMAARLTENCRLGAGLGKGQSCSTSFPLRLINNMVINTPSAARYDLRVDPENNIIEESETNNLAYDSCAGPFMKDCFTRTPDPLCLPAGQGQYCVPRSVSCKPECNKANIVTSSEHDCGGCTTPTQITYGATCTFGCGCECPSDSYTSANTLVPVGSDGPAEGRIYVTDAAGRTHIQIPVGSRCGLRNLPDLYPIFGRITALPLADRSGPNDDRELVEIKIYNGGVTAAAQSKACIYEVIVDERGRERLKDKQEFSVPALNPNKFIGATFQAAVHRLDNVYRLVADCRLEIEEQHEHNNIIQKTFS